MARYIGAMADDADDPPERRSDPCAPLTAADNAPLNDVAALRQQVAELRERLEMVQTFTQTGIFERDPHTLQGRWDRHMYGIYGLPPPADPSAQSPPYELATGMMFPEDRPAGGFRGTLGVSGTHNAHVRLRRPDGVVRHIHARWKVVDGADGRPARVVGVNSDDTEVYELARRLETAAEAARIGLWSTRTDGSLPQWNRNMFELLGLDPAQPPPSLGDWLRRCVHADDRDRIALEATTWLREGQGPIEIEFRIVRQNDQALRWVIVRGNVASTASADQRNTEGVLLDVTQQHETLQRLRDAAERVSLTASAVGLGSWDVDVERKLSLWDEGMFRLRGIEAAAQAVTREQMAMYVHPDDRSWVMADQDRQLSTGEGWRRTFRVIWPDGSVRWLASRSVPVPADSERSARRIGLNWDVTETVLAEQAMRERELAVAASLAKSRFMSRMSHELRTPLNAVLGFTQLLRAGQADTDEARRRHWLGLIDDAGRHLLALIDDVLDLSRVDAGEMRMTLQPVSLATLIDGTLPLLESQALARQVHIVVEQPVAAVVQADPVRLRQVLLNLLSNAVKYNRQGGEVRLSTQVSPGWAALHVADTGPGIDEASIAAAFEPFHRLGTDARGVEGTGIGLSIAKALVEQMGGRIEVRSSVGLGSTFSVLLPSSAAAAPEPTAGLAGAQPASSPTPAHSAQPDDAARATARVLYIEDNPVNAMLISEVLSKLEGLNLEVAVDGRSGLQRARQWQPDLVLLDMQLPDIDGVAVLHELRADACTAHLRCVALSANAMPSDVEAARAAGAIDYWTKPVNVPDFLDKMSRLLGR